MVQTGCSLAASDSAHQGGARRKDLISYSATLLGKTIYPGKVKAILLFIGICL